LISQAIIWLQLKTEMLLTYDTVSGPEKELEMGFKEGVTSTFQQLTNC